MKQKKPLTEAAKKKQQEERNKQRMDLGQQAGLITAGTLGGTFLPGKIGAPLGLVVSALSFVGKPKPWLLALGLPLLGSSVAGVYQSHGESWKAAAPEKFDLKHELTQGAERTKAYFRAMAENLWLDKIFKPKETAPDNVQTLDQGTTNGLLGHPAIEELDRLDRLYAEEAVKFQNSATDTTEAEYNTSTLDYL